MTELKNSLLYKNRHLAHGNIPVENHTVHHRPE